MSSFLDLKNCLSFKMLFSSETLIPTLYRPTTELSLAKPINGSPLTLTVAGHCTKCTVVSSCRTIECYVRGGYHASVRGDVIEVTI